ncbi:MAG: hypothetical protein Q4A07_13595 [Coriobacteriales bacterium]|nr:hypothetical protein [Coriobacteriales bacterium]
MANDKSATRVIGRGGETMQLDDDVLNFRTGGSTETMPVQSITELRIVDAQTARDIVQHTELNPYGAWTKKMEGSNGKTAYVVVKGRVSCWVMEITKNQVPNAHAFAKRIRPQFEEEEEREGYIPGRVINTPLGALFTVGSIACVFAAVMLVFQFQLPLAGIVVGLLGTIMWFRIK